LPLPSFFQRCFDRDSQDHGVPTVYQ
jgi:hypothetical protein